MIAVDVMGGDNAPCAIIGGAVRAAKSIPVTLFGPRVLIEEYLDKVAPDWRSYNINICDAKQIIDMGENPIKSVRKKSESSLVKAVWSVKDGYASAIVSAGNSGALMAASIFILGLDGNVQRPAIAGFLPTVDFSRKVFVLDLGANTDCRAGHLFQFAMIGQKYLLDFGITNPRVALLANGQEDSKGSLVTKEAFVLLKNSELNFVGNIEPYDIFMSNKVDLVICDGFSGNVLLKTLETTCKMTQGWCNWVIDNENDFKMRAVLELWFKKFSQNIELRFGYKKQGGAQLLGVSGNVIICHGNSDAYAIENAIKFAWNISNKK